MYLQSILFQLRTVVMSDEEAVCSRLRSFVLYKLDVFIDKEEYLLPFFNAFSTIHKIF